MNIRILPVLILFLGISAIFAQPQKFEVAANMGYQFGGQVDETEKDEGQDILKEALGINGAVNYGFIVDVWLTRGLQLELFWDQQPSQLNFIDRPNDNQQTKVTDLKVQYYQAGLLYNWSTSGKQPFVGGSIGFARMIPSGDFETETQPSVGVLFGYKTFLSQYFGIRLHGRVMITDMPRGELFKNPEGEGFSHEKSTFLTQIQLGLALTFGM